MLSVDGDEGGPRIGASDSNSDTDFVSIIWTGCRPLNKCVFWFVVFKLYISESLIRKILMSHYWASCVPKTCKRLTLGGRLGVVRNLCHLLLRLWCSYLVCLWFFICSYGFVTFESQEDAEKIMKRTVGTTAHIFIVYFVFSCMVWKYIVCECK